jgi:hypothetical protein
VFELSGSTWTQLGDDIVGEGNGDQFGWSIDFSRDGSALAIAAWKSRALRGVVHVYSYREATWEYLGEPIFGAKDGDTFGCWISVSDDAKTMAVGSWREDATETDPAYIKILHYDDGLDRWQQIGETIDMAESHGAALYIEFGLAVAISANGDAVAIGSLYADNAAGRVSMYAFENTTLL